MSVCSVSGIVSDSTSASTESNRQSSTRVACSENSAKLTPTPSHVAPERIRERQARRANVCVGTADLGNTSRGGMAMICVAARSLASAHPGENSGRGSTASAEPVALDALRRWAVLLDSAFRVPGTSIRFGLDAIVGLIPGIGDISTPVFAALLLLQAVRMRAAARRPGADGLQRGPRHADRAGADPRRSRRYRLEGEPAQPGAARAPRPPRACRRRAATICSWRSAWRRSR